MIKRFEGLLARLGLTREAGTRSFALDASLHSALVALAEQEQSPVEEVQADLLATALAPIGKRVNGGKDDECLYLFPVKSIEPLGEGGTQRLDVQSISGVFNSRNGGERAT